MVAIEYQWQCGGDGRVLSEARLEAARAQELEGAWAAPIARRRAQPTAATQSVIDPAFLHTRAPSSLGGEWLCAPLS
jgi:hypothetical protein